MRKDPIQKKAQRKAEQRRMQMEREKRTEASQAPGFRIQERVRKTARNNP